jgi:hypothetical protein
MFGNHLPYLSLLAPLPVEEGEIPERFLRMFGL